MHMQKSTRNHPPLVHPLKLMCPNHTTTPQLHKQVLARARRRIYNPRRAYTCARALVGSHTECWLAVRISVRKSLESVCAVEEVYQRLRKWCFLQRKVAGCAGGGYGLWEKESRGRGIGG